MTINPYEPPQVDERIPKAKEVREPSSWNNVLLLTIIIAVILVFLALLIPALQPAIGSGRTHK